MTDGESLVSLISAMIVSIVAVHTCWEDIVAFFIMVIGVEVGFPLVVSISRIVGNVAPAITRTIVSALTSIGMSSSSGMCPDTTVKDLLSVLWVNGMLRVAGAARTLEIPGTISKGQLARFEMAREINTCKDVVSIQDKAKH